jgi:hypothetical protein
MAKLNAKMKKAIILLKSIVPPSKRTRGGALETKMWMDHMQNNHINNPPTQNNIESLSTNKLYKDYDNHRKTADYLDNAGLHDSATYMRRLSAYKGKIADKKMSQDSLLSAQRIGDVSSINKHTSAVKQHTEDSNELWNGLGDAKGVIIPSLPEYHIRMNKEIAEPVNLAARQSGEDFTNEKNASAPDAESDNGTEDETVPTSTTPPTGVHNLVRKSRQYQHAVKILAKMRL